jgi:hypothetical protein
MLQIAVSFIPGVREEEVYVIWLIVDPFHEEVVVVWILFKTVLISSIPDRVIIITRVLAGIIMMWFFVRSYASVIAAVDDLEALGTVVTGAGPSVRRNRHGLPGVLLAAGFPAVRHFAVQEGSPLGRAFGEFGPLCELAVASIASRAGTART